MLAEVHYVSPCRLNLYHFKFCLVARSCLPTTSLPPAAGRALPQLWRSRLLTVTIRRPEDQFAWPNITQINSTRVPHDSYVADLDYSVEHRSVRDSYKRYRYALIAHCYIPLPLRVGQW